MLFCNRDVMMPVPFSTCRQQCRKHFVCRALLIARRDINQTIRVTGDVTLLPFRNMLSG